MTLSFFLCYLDLTSGKYLVTEQITSWRIRKANLSCVKHLTNKMCPEFNSRLKYVVKFLVSISPKIIRLKPLT